MSLIVFDLDGTLVDSSRDLAESTNDVLRSYGAGPLPLDRVAGMVGEGAKVLVERALAESGRVPAPADALQRFLEFYEARLLEHTRPYEGIIEVLRDAARRARLALLTNKPAGPSVRILEAFDVAAPFTWVIGGDSVFPRKPDPSALQHLMGQAGASAEQTLFVGDSMIDVETARRAGVRMCVAGYGYGAMRGDLVLAGDEFLAEQPSDVGRVIDRFLSGPTAFAEPDTSAR